MSHTILVVISDALERQEIVLSLTHEGFEVVAAEDGFSGLEKAEEIQPAVFVMDIGLQGLNGLEISQLLRERSQFSGIPIFLCTEKDNPLISEAEHLAVANEILFKPIDRSLLLRSIRQQLGIPEPQEESKLSLSETPPEDNSVRIEELLGWETPAVRTSQASSPSESLPTSGSEGQADSLSSNPQVHEALENVWEGKGIESLIRLEPEVQSPPPISTETAFQSLPSFSPDRLQEMVEKMAREMIEKVVWEVVPRLAEAEVKKEIERLKKGE